MSIGYLEGYRVVDLTDHRGILAGRMLADLGADVIAVEPPAGSETRSRPPFWSEGQSKHSAVWDAYAHNKRSITCDVSNPIGRSLIIDLCRSADFVIYSGRPEDIKMLGLGYDDIREVNSRIIYVSITPFGVDGPKANYEDSDLIIWASSGALVRSRFGGRQPVRIGGAGQAYHHAATEAIAGALLALAERARSGEGQYVDISAQNSLVFVSQLQGLYPFLGDRPAAAGGDVSAFPLVWEAADGFVQFSLTSGPATGHFSNAFMLWLEESGFMPCEHPRIDWRRLRQTSGSGLSNSGNSNKGEWISQEHQDSLQIAMEKFFRAKTMEELFIAARDRRLLLAPIQSIPQVMDYPQLLARDFWFDVGTDSIAKRVPGPFARMIPPGLSNQRNAPEVGQHNTEVYGVLLGKTIAELDQLRKEGVI